MLKNLYDWKFDLQLFADDVEGEQNQEQETKDQEPKTFDETYVKDLRTEAARYRTKAKELEQQLQTLPGEITSKVLAALGLEPDPDKNFEKQLAEAQAKAQEAEKRANERLVRAEVIALATDMALVDSDAALALMDRSSVAVKDDGTVSGAKEALEALVAAKPWLKKAEAKQPVGGGTNPPGGNSIKTIDQQIDEAVKAGNTMLAIKLKNQKFFKE